jgi:hypothetical protein
MMLDTRIAGNPESWRCKSGHMVPIVKLEGGVLET